MSTNFSDNPRIVTLCSGTSQPWDRQSYQFSHYGRLAGSLLRNWYSQIQLYCNDPKFSDRLGSGANSVDPDQGLHCLLFHLHLFDEIP